MTTRSVLRAAAFAAVVPLFLATPAHASIAGESLNNLDALNSLNALGIKSGATNTAASDQSNGNLHAHPAG
ncbi:hypothetical protein [Streptomyces sp. CC208A]|uniref:hypothetical protein n=1 Tax=Streptomyces sp. CC208A TaxID=3044573 RepID=UPI0024A92B18|nr:hypothetical protein [Streptomyces sp. CC208A]